MSDMEPYDPYRTEQQPLPSSPMWPASRPRLPVPAVMTDQRPINAAAVAIAWVLAVLTLAYMLPWAIAATRGKANHAAIGLLNLFLGWSLIGWIVAIVMACQAHQVVGAGTTVMVAQQFSAPPPQPLASPPPGWYPSPSGFGQQYWDGTTWTEHQTP